MSESHNVINVVSVDADVLANILAAATAAAAALSAVADAVQAQAVALNALADAIAAPIEEEAESEDNRPRYMDGSLIDP